LLSRLSLAVLLLAALGSVAWAKPKVAVLGLEASNSGVVEPKDAANAAKLTDELRSIPRSGIGKYELAPNSNRELQDEKLMGNCDTEKPACMTPIGAGLGADYLIYGSIVKAAEKGKDGYKANLKLLNVKTKTVDEQSETFVPLTALAGGNGAKEWAQKVYAKLTGEKPPAPERPTEAGPGKLLVKGNVKSGDVFIGTAKKGSLAGGTITLTLPEGAHELAIEAPGHKRYEATVTVTGGQTKTVDAVLEEVLATTPPPPPPGKGGSNRGTFKIAGYGLAGVAVAAGGYVLYTYLAGPIPAYEDLGMRPKDPATGMEIGTEAGSGSCDDNALRVYNDPTNRAFDKACTANKWRTTGAIVGIASGVLAAGALYFAYRGEGNTAETQAMGRRTRRQLTVTPVISPSGGGATVRFDW
jgi:hypothetical protein